MQGKKLRNIEFCGHSCFLLRDGRHSVIIDPFLSGNPVAVRKPEEVSVEAVLLTHGHGDHIGDGRDFPFGRVITDAGMARICCI